MKAKDLRLGNLVTIDNEQHWSELKGKAMVVVGLEKIKQSSFSYPLSNYWISIEDEGGTEYFQSNEFIKPISITMEWIRKLGFVFETLNEDSTPTQRKYRKAVIGSDSIPFKIEFDTYNESFTLDFVERKLINYNYVHELQNLYNLHTRLELSESIEVDAF